MKTQYVAFFDGEFTANTKKQRGLQELIQYALIIVPLHYNENQNQYIIEQAPVEICKSYVKPIYTTQLSDYIKDLTKIKQEEVDNGISFEKAIDSLASLIKKYKIKHVYTWGPDNYLLRMNAKLVVHNKKSMRTFSNVMNDISNDISKLFNSKKVLSQKQAETLLNIDSPYNTHNAYDDAMRLFEIYKKIFIEKGEINENQSKNI